MSNGTSQHYIFAGHYRDSTVRHRASISGRCRDGKGVSFGLRMSRSDAAASSLGAGLHEVASVIDGGFARTVSRRELPDPSGTQAPCQRPLRWFEAAAFARPDSSPVSNLGCLRDPMMERREQRSFAKRGGQTEGGDANGAAEENATTDLFLLAGRFVAVVRM